MDKSKEWSKTLREDTKQGTGCKEIAKFQNDVPKKKEKKAIDGCKQISEKAGLEKHSGDCKRPAERLGDNRH